MNTTWNFCAGPAMLPQEVMQQAQAELLNWHGLGVSVMEISHRSPEFEALAAETKKDLRELLALPDEFEILFTTGGGQGQFALVPMNLLAQDQRADYLITGSWSEKAAAEAQRFAQINIAANSKADGYHKIPARDSWQLDPAARYFHYVSNETVYGVQFHTAPEVDKLLVADMSSDFLSRSLDFKRFGLIYAGAQKNIGSAGLTVVLIRRDWLENCGARVPRVFRYDVLAATQSLANTPPSFSWYLAGLVFKWLKQQGGLAAMAERNQQKAKLLYDAIDQSSLYRNPVDTSCRSMMNVVFDLPNEQLLARFLTEARTNGLLYLKGHKERGGVRASIYNAMPLAGVTALVDFMKAFEKNA